MGDKPEATNPIPPEPIDKQAPKADSKPTRVPAGKLLVKLLKENKIDFMLGRPRVRHMEDNGMVIEPPQIKIFYTDEVPASAKAVPQQQEAPAATLESQNGRSS